MKDIIKTDLQRFTRLPIEVIHKVDGLTPTIMVKTPMRNDAIELKERRYSLLGSATEVEKGLIDICKEFTDLERESIEFFFKEWLSKNK